VDALVGTDFIRRIPWVHAGAPVQFGVGQYRLVAPNGEARGLLPFLELEPGVYSAHGDGGLLTHPGVYMGTVTLVKDGTLDYRLVDRFQVGHWQPGLVPRWELVQRVARGCQDLWLGQCTATSYTLIVDTNNRWEPDHFFQGAEVYLYAGQGRGQTRRVQAWSNLARAAEVYPLSTSAHTDTRYQMHKRHSVTDYWDAINRAIGRVRTHALLPITDESLATVVTDHVPTYEYQVPAGVDYLSKVYWRDTSGSHPADWVELSRMTQDWDVLPGGILRLPTVYPDHQLRLVGQMLPADLQDDDAYCTLEPEYVVAQAIAYVLEQRVNAATNDSEDARGRMTYYQTLANQRAPNGRTWPNSLRTL
jgi:hypothetical protein